MTQFDAIVVGAGPAGSTAARELAASGARVLLLDRERFPRYKACGGGIPLRTERLLPFPLGDVVEDSVSQIDVSYRGRMTYHLDSGTPFAHMVMRDRFDALLLRHAQLAGAEFRPATAVRAVEEQDGMLRISAEGFEAEATYLICADGAHSPVGKMAGLGEGIEECAAWELEIASPGLNASGYRARSLIELGYRPWGYAWLFPKRDLLSIGIVLPRDQAGTMKRRTAALVERLGFGRAEVRIARGHKIRFRRGGEAIANAHALLVGDAAGLADEFTEEGIFYAVESGRIAARATLAALSGTAPLSAYQRAIDREVMPELHAARQIAFMFYGMLKRAPRAWMFASARTPFLWNAFFAVQRGESTYARETARVPLLPGIADRMLRRQ